MNYWKVRTYPFFLVLIVITFFFWIQCYPLMFSLVVLIICILSIAGYLIHWDWKWNKIEKVNESIGITRKNTYIDANGYIRWNENDNLCHRDVAWNNKIRHESKPFGEYDIHHIDENKFNNKPDNLEILTRETHKLEHGQILYENGRKNIRLVPAFRKRKETVKAILIGGKYGQWYPKSQLIVRRGYIYGTEWIVRKKGG